VIFADDFGAVDVFRLAELRLSQLEKLLIFVQDLKTISAKLLLLVLLLGRKLLGGEDLVHWRLPSFNYFIL